MKNLFSLLEDLFVAVAFAEAGEYEALSINPAPAWLTRRFQCSTAS